MLSIGNYKEVLEVEASSMSYTRAFFNPPTTQFPTQVDFSKQLFQVGDRREGGGYVYTEKIILAINVALATTRPLLIRGPSGSGKSSLAYYVARDLGWQYYEHVVSSRTQARDLLWRFDSLRRLNDAQANQIQKEPGSYIEPGVLWWAFDRETAMRLSPLKFNTENHLEQGRAVVLIDEIDKADPDVPNDLLVPLGSGKFIVEETNTEIKANSPPAVFITTNEERVLPDAFLRRCVVLIMEPPNERKLVEIARIHFGSDPKQIKLYESIAHEILKDKSDDLDTRLITPNAAEYLDTVLACLTLGVEPHDKSWNAIFEATLLKSPSLREDQ